MRKFTFLLGILTWAHISIGFAGTAFTDRAEWEAALTGSQIITEDFTEFSEGWQGGAVSSEYTMVVDWGTIYNEKGIYISNFGGNMLSTNMYNNVMIPPSGGAGFIAFGFDYIGFIDITLLDGNGDVIETMRPQGILANSPPGFYGYICFASDPVIGEIPIYSYSGASYLDNISTVVSNPPDTPNAPADNAPAGNDSDGTGCFISTLSNF